MLLETRIPIYGIEVGTSMVFKTYHQKLLDTRNKNIYGLGVGISTLFEIFMHFLFKRGGDHPVWS
jgi:hypothetical protein